MKASCCIGRVGSLAVALGVGAAIVAAGSGTAWADADSAESPGSSASGAPTGDGPGSPDAVRSGRGGSAMQSSVRSRLLKRSGPGSVSAPGPASAVGVLNTTTGAVSATVARLGDMVRPARGSAPAPAAATADGTSANITSVRPGAPAVLPASSVQAVSGVQSPLAAGMRADRPRPAPLEGLVVVITSGLNFALALRRDFGIGAISPRRHTSTLVLNGYDIVPSSTETVTSFYGRWTYFPGGPGMVQGQQQFDVVDPSTGENLGSFDALVSRGYAFNYTELLVTSNDGINVGTGAGQVPPVGSVIVDCTAGNVGWRYTALPSPSGDAVSFSIVTPFGSIRLPMRFNAAEGIAERTVDNRPMDLGNGYSIAPADPTGETFIGVSGILPLFTTVQGYQKFNVYDSAGNPVGSFDGVFTTTADIILAYTQAVLVTANDGINVGTGAGQVPPVGSVYNVFYTNSDDNYILYSSLPSPSGDVISVIQGKPNGTVKNISTWLLTRLDASTPPLVPALSMPRGNRFVPVSELTPSGVNGLPPREVQIQGYQQFDVYDAAGNRIGAVDADVSTQWDLFGVYSESLLITNVAEGTAGTEAGQVPPVGSVYEFVYFGSNRFGTAYSAMPSEPCDVLAFKLLTPFGGIPLFTRYNATGGLADVSYFDPFVTP